MLWDITYPSDGIQANTLDTALRNTKLLISERARVNNGVWEEHSFFGAGATGLHPLSQVDWVGIYADYEAMVGGSYPEGSLHFVIAPPSTGLYVYTNGAFSIVTSLDHTELEVGTDDDHTQYYLKDSTRPMSKEVRMAMAIVESTPGVAADNPMPSSHNALSWYNGHGIDGEFVISRHFLDSALLSLKSGYMSGMAGPPHSFNPFAFIDMIGADGQYLSVPAFEVMIDGSAQIGNLDVPYNGAELQWAGNSRMSCTYGLTPFGTGTCLTPVAYTIAPASEL